MKHTTFALALLTVALFAGAIAFAGSGPFAGPGPFASAGPYAGYGQSRPAECPDADGDGICNGQDPDYVPGDQCLSGDCPNPDCPDADGDGICNGQDPDYVRPGDGPRRLGVGIRGLAIRTLARLGLHWMTF